jgi:hypothetical protein
MLLCTYHISLEKEKRNTTIQNISLPECILSIFFYVTTQCMQLPFAIPSTHLFIMKHHTARILLKWLVGLAAESLTAKASTMQTDMRNMVYTSVMVAEILENEGNLPAVETGRLREPLVRAKSPERGSVQYLLAASKLDTLNDTSRREEGRKQTN